MNRHIRSVEGSYMEIEARDVNCQYNKFVLLGGGGEKLVVFPAGT